MLIKLCNINMIIKVLGSVINVKTVHLRSVVLTLMSLPMCFLHGDVAQSFVELFKSD